MKKLFLIVLLAAMLLEIYQLDATEDPTIQQQQEQNSTSVEGGNSNENPTSVEGGNNNGNSTSKEGGNSNENPTSGEGGNSNGNPTNGQGGKNNGNPTNGQGGKNNKNSSSEEDGDNEDSSSEEDESNDDHNPANGCWTQWFDRDDPTAIGDRETLEELHSENPGKICNKPLRIQVKTTSERSVASTGNVIAVSDTITGFICQNSDQPESMPCEDYKVRFFCPENFCRSNGCWTQWFNRDDPSGSGDWETLENLYKENPGKICNKPLWIEVETTSGDSVASTGDVINVSDTSTGFICMNSAQSDSMCENYKVRFLCPQEFCNPQVCWTQWFDRDTPRGIGDWELLCDLRAENPGQICDRPLYIEVQNKLNSLPAAFTGNSFHTYSPTEGFACCNCDQRSRQCQNYKVRFGCPCNV